MLLKSHDRTDRATCGKSSSQPQLYTPIAHERQNESGTKVRWMHREGMEGLAMPRQVTKFKSFFFFFLPSFSASISTATKPQPNGEIVMFAAKRNEIEAIV
nr:hypothetical protein Iba_chr13eCG4600 [Ipomoea batatas]